MSDFLMLMLVLVIDAAGSDATNDEIRMTNVRMSTLQVDRLLHKTMLK